MASGAYSFIDLAVLDPVRRRFAAGDPLVMLSIDLETVLWANGAGAAMFGFSDIESVMGAPAGLAAAARRQIAAAPGYPDIGRDRALAVRLATGLASRAAPFLASGVALPDGERAILLAAPAQEGNAPDPRAAAERAIAGFSEAGYFAALIDGEGSVMASTAGFAALNVDRDALAGLVAEVRGERDRLVKRLVSAGRARYPAGFARLTEDPALHLLLVVGEDQSSAPVEEPPVRPAEKAAPRQEATRDHAFSPATADLHAADGARTQIDRWYFGLRDEAPDAPAEATPSAPAAIQNAGPAEDEPPAAPVREESEATASLVSPVELAAVQRPAAPQGERPRASAKPHTAGAVRFVWRTDAEGRFSAISPEFAEAVGANAADVIGRRFRDVANAFGFDPGGEIAGLLERRDTWSGRSVLWPIAGSDLKAPVDLAALPVYARDRSFEGFRGFGVARIGDAVSDPEAIGLALVEGGQRPAEREPSPADDADAAKVPEAAPPTDPFRGEVPALVIDNTPERRFTDKVIRLAEHRQPSVERSLTPVERSAFREIGDRLKKDAARRPAASEPTPPTEPVATAQVEQEEAEAEIAEQALRAETRDAEIEPQGDKTAAPSRDEVAPADEEAHVATEAVLDIPEAQTDDAKGGTPAVGAAEIGAFEAPAWSSAAPPPVQAEGFLPAAFPDETANAPRQVDISILSRLPVPVLIHSGDRLHYGNREFLELTRYDSIEALAEAGGLDALFVDAYDVEEGSPPDDRRMRLRRRSGEEIPVEALLQSVPWGGGKALLLAIRPTARVEVEADGPAAEPSPAASEDLEARLAELRTILDTATDGVVLITPEGAIRSISRPAEALFGFESAEVAGEPFTALFAVESQKAAHDYLSGLSDNGVASVLNDGREVIGREAQGRFIPLFMTIGKLPGDSGYCAVMRDITQWKRAEEELTQARAQAERSSSQKTDFLARVSHEIRTPLNAIIGFSELMIDEKFGPVGNDRYRDYLRDINRSANHVLDLVNDLLDISKIEAGEQEMSYEAVSLNDTLAESVAMLQPQANRERVIIRSSFASRLPEVVADLRSVRQIAINLLSNAIRYTPAGGQVIISTSYETSGDIVMRVRDTGIGMTHAEIEQALKPFKQINALRRGRGDGTGLGLPLTKAMVEANRARFSINSTPGEGTMVEITFPSTRVLAD